VEGERGGVPRIPADTERENLCEMQVGTWLAGEREWSVHNNLEGKESILKRCKKKKFLKK